MKKYNRWIVLGLLFTIHCSLFTSEALAQPKQRRTQTVQQQTQQRQASPQQQGGAQQSSQQGGMTQRMRIQYPTSVDMPENVVWRRDIYREIDVTKEENAGLYDPVEPQGKRLNLFTYVFKLALNGYIPVYEYNLDGNEVLEPTAKVDMKSILDNYRIMYEEQGGKLKVENSDIPSADVKLYYLKECAYFDQANSSFHIKPIAFCPVMVSDDFGDGESITKYPLFWVKYSEVEPYLSRQEVKTSDVNDAAVMNMDDFFTLNKYKGKIYKTANRLGKTLAQVAGEDSAKYSAEQLRIEAELEAFRQNLFGDKARKDSLDSIANADPKLAKAAAKRQSRNKEARASSKRERGGGSAGGSQSARVSVRRERH
ncbi:MAG: gliding motility protein GldN [Prevotella sp.]|nr:gliding motility protein GldN [Prevotella sp.]